MARRWPVGTAVAVLVALTLQRCIGLPNKLDDDTETADLVRAALLVSDMLNTSGPAAFSRLEADTSSNPSACNVLFAGVGCDAGVRIYRFTDDEGVGCPLQTGLTVFGTTRLRFSDPGCDDGVDGTIDRTVDGHYFQRKTDGKIYLVYTNAGVIGNTVLEASDLKNYRGVTRSGGSRITVAAGETSLHISGIHQWSVFNGSYAFHHTLYTDAGQAIDVALSGPETTLNGFATLDQNRTKTTYLVKYVDTRIGVSCRYPLDGSVVFYRQASATPTSPSGTPVPTATATPTPTSTATPLPGTPTATPSPTPFSSVPIDSEIEVTFPGACGRGILRVDGGSPVTVELLP